MPAGEASSSFALLLGKGPHWPSNHAGRVRGAHFVWSVETAREPILPLLEAELCWCCPILGAS